LGVCGPLHNVVTEHAAQFCNVFLFDKEVGYGITSNLVGQLFCWYIWKERNNRVFALKNTSIDTPIDKVKALSW
jgi:hypothetical protein